jgi:NTP pyrophosphatase (non-canonical NTP hydrolase)
MLDLALIQEQVKEWANRNFGNVQSWQPLIGMQEELGELSHAFLKREQGIRGTVGEHNAAIRDALGDIVIYMLDFCQRENIELEEVIRLTWSAVKVRDWQKNPATGVAQ